MMDYSKIHEWLLTIHHEKALGCEDYETCNAIQLEVDRRIENGTINHGLMLGFKYYNPKTKQFEGEPKFDGLNGLFSKYQYDSKSL